MIDRDGIVARRARASDGEKLVAFVTCALRGRLELDVEAVIARLGEVGFFLAEQDGRLLGLLGWHIENLVACVTDLLIWSAVDRLQVAEVLLDEMESAAARLSAEAALLLLPRSSSRGCSRFVERLGTANARWLISLVRGDRQRLKLVDETRIRFRSSNSAPSILSGPFEYGRTPVILGLSERGQCCRSGVTCQS